MNFLKGFIAKIQNRNELLLLHLAIIVLFTFIYYNVSKKSEEDKPNFKTLEDSLYYTIITHFTIGFGDVSPKSKTMRRLTMLQAFIAFTLMNV